MAHFDYQFGLTDIEEMSKTHLCVTVRVRPALWAGSQKQREEAACQHTQGPNFIGYIY